MNSFEVPLKVLELLAGFDKAWFVAGGWAIDLFIGRVTRTHEDIEIAILRQDQLALQSYLTGWKFEKVIPGQKMRREKWNQQEWLALPVHEIHARNAASDPSALEILLNESSVDEWKFRRNLKITRPLSMIGLRSKDGIPYLNPEIVLLYKAKDPTRRDEADFENAVQILDTERKRWLKQALAVCHPGHRWLEIL
jgi:hypothetical protein